MDDSKEKDSTGSYVEPRIPSITGYGQRRVNGKHKKVLDYSLEINHSGIPKIDVCLRLKPRGGVTRSCDDTLSVLNDNTVACFNGNTREDVTEYTFSSVFGPDVDQKTFFNTWVYDKVLRFLNGNSELLFAYGTTNAGKTYTMHGTTNDPGLIPRTLVFVFNTLNNKLLTQCKYKPDKVMAAHVLDDQLMENEEDIRNKILNNFSCEKTQDDHKYLSQVDEGQNGIDNLTSKNIVKIFDTLKNDEKASLDHGDSSYTVWVTYSEIYNESIYDLFDISCSGNQKRTALKLTLDQNKNVYVKGLTHVFVRSAEEAYKALCFGRNNLKIASNTLNKLSSRSHCIFTLKLMRVENVENPSTAVISSIAFCDLAGTERLKKTMNIGDRLIESKKINTSLLVLNKCFSVLRDNQKRGENLLVPYRESKLTQMFQTALTGNNQTGVSMAVNVDMSPGLFDETKQVLFMSAIMRSIAKSKTKNSKPRPSFVVWAANNCKSLSQVNSKQDTILEDEEDLNNGSNSEKKIMVESEEFKNRLIEENKKVKQEMISQFHKILADNRIFHDNQKETALKYNTEMYENKIERLKSHYQEKIQERDEKLNSLSTNLTTKCNKSEIEDYEFQMGELQLQKEDFAAEINALKKEQTVLQQNLDNKNQEIEVLKNVQTTLQQDLENKNQQIENFKIMINEANVEYQCMDANLNEIHNKFDDACNELKEKDLEIERLTGSLEAKEDIITEMETNREEQLAEYAEKKILECMEEKFNEIIGLEDKIKKDKIRYKKCSEEKSEIAKEYAILKQQYQMEVKSINHLTSNNKYLSSELSDMKSKISELKKHTETLESTLRENEIKFKNELQAVLKSKISSKPESRTIAVLTDISNIQLPITMLADAGGKENMDNEKKPIKKYKTKTQMSARKTKNNKNDETPQMCEKMLNEAINNIPISTRKRKLFDNKPPPLTDSSNIPSDFLLDSVLTPTTALRQTTKLRIKK